MPTPLGNLGDLSPRAQKTLGDAGRILAEDTRHTGELLSHLGLHVPMISLHDHNERDRLNLVANLLDQGINLALVSDAGTPTISDPGYHLISALKEAGYSISALPGPCAAITALSASGLASDTFTFIGFLPQSGAARKKAIEEILSKKETLILYESPRRIHDLLAELAPAGHRQLAIARELTKVHEEIIRSFCDTITLEEVRPQGEFTVILGPKVADAESAQKESATLRRLIELALNEGLSVKSAAALASKFLASSKKEAYQIALSITKTPLE